MNLISWDVIIIDWNKYHVIWYTKNNKTLFIQNINNWKIEQIENQKIFEVESYRTNSSDFIDMKWRPLRVWDIFIDKDSKDLVEKNYIFKKTGEKVYIYTKETSDYEECTYNYDEFKSDCFIINDENNSIREFEDYLKEINKKKEKEWILWKINDLKEKAIKTWIDITNIFK